MATQSARALSVTAGATVSANRFLALQSDGKFDHAGAGLDAQGVALEAGVDTDRIPMAVPDGGVVKVTAGAAVAVGAIVASDATGRAVTTASADVELGYALSAASGAGELIDVLFMRGAKATA